MAAPFGVTIATILLAYLAEPHQWASREGLRLAGSLVDLGAVLYGMFIVLVERGIAMIWWALEQRQKWREERLARQEKLGAERAAREEQARAEGRAEGRAEAYIEVLEAFRGQPDDKWDEILERLARERGITPDDTPSPNGSSN